jgi:hypothetical protein
MLVLDVMPRTLPRRVVLVVTVLVRFGSACQEPGRRLRNFRPIPRLVLHLWQSSHREALRRLITASLRKASSKAIAR